MSLIQVLLLLAVLALIFGGGSELGYWGGGNRTFGYGGGGLGLILLAVVIFLIFR